MHDEELHTDAMGLIPAGDLRDQEQILGTFGNEVPVSAGAASTDLQGSPFPTGTAHVCCTALEHQLTERRAASWKAADHQQLLHWNTTEVSLLQQLCAELHQWSQQGYRELESRSPFCHLVCWQLRS